MDVLAAGQYAGVADRIATGPGNYVLAIEGPQQAFHLHIRADLLQAKAQIGEQFIQFSPIHLGETGLAAGPQPRAGELEAEAGH